MRSDWHIARTGCIYMENTDHIRVESCFFDQIGGNGIFMSGFNKYNVVFNNNFVDGGASCVNLIGLLSSVRCASNWSGSPACTDKTPGPLTQDYPAFIRVKTTKQKNEFIPGIIANLKMLSFQTAQLQ